MASTQRRPNTEQRHDFLWGKREVRDGNIVAGLDHGYANGEALFEEHWGAVRKEARKYFADQNQKPSSESFLQTLAVTEEFSLAQRSADQNRITHLCDEIAGLTQSEDNLQRALRIAEAGYWDWNLTTGFWDGSVQLFELLELEPGSEKTYEGYLNHVHPSDRDQLREVVNEALLRRSDYELNYRIILKDGTVRHFQERGRLVSDGEGKSDHISAVICDNTERHDALKEVVKLSYNDPVTGLPNRKALMAGLQQKIGKAERENGMAAVMIVNVDNFRGVNEARGQEFGDHLLKEIGLRLQDACGEVGLVACLGADEFVIVTGEAVHVDDLDVLASETLKVLNAPFAVAGQVIHLAASVGISVFPSDTLTAVNLIQMAQMAVIRAKKGTAKKYSFFNEKMAEEAIEHARIGSALISALGDSEFSLHYQPKISVETGQIVGLEALIRWTSPKLGSISPAIFIPIAEETAVIRRLGGWVIQSVCHQYGEWVAAGCTPPPIAVNVAGPQLEPGFIKTVETALSESGVLPQQLHMELTETSLIENLDVALPLLHELKSLGIGLSIDDFGTGYSSLSYLQKFPVDALKIDSSFVQNLDENRESKAIVEATIILAHSLGLSVVAEGVETLAQLKALRDLGCDEIQGYYFSRPIPAEEVVGLLNSQVDLWSIG